MSRFIFIVGAPGSKWSAVARSVYLSPSVDRSDHREGNEYRHGSSGVNHVGAYFDPGMGLGEFFDEIASHAPQVCEAEFNRPFATDQGLVRIIKSHTLSKHLGFLRTHWPDCPIVTVWRDDQPCLDWWLGAGGFAITYPSYVWYRDEAKMRAEIITQNRAIRDWDATHEGTLCRSSDEMADCLGLVRAETTLLFDDMQVRVTPPK